MEFLFDVGEMLKGKKRGVGLKCWSMFSLQFSKARSSDPPITCLRTLWLVCAVLFQAAVKVDCPRSFSARFMAFVWALFAILFLSLYTANLAAFMIPREKFYDFNGLDDERISNPLGVKPGLRIATVPHTYSYFTLAKYHHRLFSHIKGPSLAFKNSEEAVEALKEGSLDAFVYDGTVLNYIASQDDDCRIMQVGSWSSMTGFSLAFPLNSKYADLFNKELLEMKENGEMERLNRFWMSGVCKPNEQEKRASDPLSIAQFLSAFLLLLLGLAASTVFLCVEHIYAQGLKSRRAFQPPSGCLSLVSTVKAPKDPNGNFSDPELGQEEFRLA